MPHQAICPQCGHTFTIDLSGLVPLTERQHQVLDQLTELQRWRRGPVKTSVIADLMNFTPRYIRRYLRELEQLGLICRIRKRGGWALPVQQKSYLYQAELRAV